MSSTEIISENQKKLARFAKAMGHPIRVFILEYLSKQSCCYSGDLSEILPIAKSTLSQHLKELKNVGLIQGEINPPKIRYCVNYEKWEELKKTFEKFFDK
ncbi:MAG: metalloregulator ArsR/SmtB family transcription factor [Bacteroidota bacterium]|nr:metalloregulator ArsR/SmtB family transcription factor [Bacteroidota bacterium]